MRSPFIQRHFFCQFTLPSKRRRHRLVFVDVKFIRTHIDLIALLSEGMYFRTTMWMGVLMFICGLFQLPTGIKNPFSVFLHAIYSNLSNFYSAIYFTFHNYDKKNVYDKGWQVDFTSSLEFSCLLLLMLGMRV